MEKIDPLNLAKRISSELSSDLSEELKGKKSKPKRIRTAAKSGSRKKKSSKDKIIFPEEERERRMQAMAAAMEIGDEEEVGRIHEEMKTGEEHFEEAQALEAEEKFKKTQKESPEEKIKKRFGKDETTAVKNYDAQDNEIKEEEKSPLRTMEDIEKERAEKARKTIASEKSDYEKTVKEIDAQERLEKEEAEQRSAKFEQLKLELDQARKEYLEVDYKKKTAWKQVTGFFGKFIKSGRDTGNEEVLHYKDIYLKKLFDYKNALLEDAKTRGASNKELGDLVKLFGVEVDCNLIDVRDQVKMENQGKWIGLFTERGKNIVNWYNKLPRYKKLAVGVSFGLASSVAVGFGGAALAGMAGIAVSGKRVFLGAVTGTNVAIGTEAYLRRRTERRIKNKAEAMTEQFDKYENLNLDEKLKAVDEKIKMMAGDVDKKIAKNKYTKLAAASLGILVGTVIGSGTLSELFGEGFKKTTGWAKQIIAEHLGHHIEAPVPGGGIHAPEVTETPEAPEVAPETPEVLLKADLLTIKEGGSLEKVITKYFEEHPDLIEKYGELHGHRNFNPGQIAHRLYLDYLHDNHNPLNKSLNLVYPGAEVEIDPATLRITEFSDTKGAIGRAIEQVAGNHEKWAGMKNLSLKELAGAAKNKITELSGEYGKFWGSEAEIKSGEKIKNWLARVARLAMEKK